MRRKHALTAAVVLLIAVPAAAAPPGKLPPSNTTPPAISGDTTSGQTLTAGTGSWEGNGLHFSFQWQRCNSSGAACAALGGAASSTYTTGDADVGSTMVAAVTATNARGTATAVSAPSGVIAPPPASVGGDAGTSAPANLTAPAISGTPSVGTTLTASTGTWSGSPTSFSYQWFYCDSVGLSCSAITGATGPTYTPVTWDVGGRDQVRVTATNAGGSTTASSSPTAVVTSPNLAPAVVAAPAISGSAVAGQTLIGSTGTWNGTPTSYSYQWYYCDSAGANCSAIGGANSSTYTPVTDDVGGRDKVRVTATNSTGSTWADSSPTAVVQTASTTSSTSSTTGALYYSQSFDGGGWACPLCSVDSSGGTATVAMAGQQLDLTVSSSTGGPNASSNAASLSVCNCNPQSWTGGEGRDVWYGIKVFFPSNSQFPTGDGQDVYEWHTSDKVGTGPTSSFMGVETDFPVTSSPGVNPRLTFWVRGGYFDSSGRHISEKLVSMPSNSLLLNHWYSIQFHMHWSADPAKAVSDWYVDGVQRAHVTGYANLFRFADGTTDQTGIGLYNYRLKSSWTNTISFDDFKVGSGQSAVQ
jgi:hypothetical protein